MQRVANIPEIDKHEKKKSKSRSDMSVPIHVSQINKQPSELLFKLKHLLLILEPSFKIPKKETPNTQSMCSVIVICHYRSTK